MLSGRRQGHELFCSLVTEFICWMLILGHLGVLVTWVDFSTTNLASIITFKFGQISKAFNLHVIATLFQAGYMQFDLNS